MVRLRGRERVVTIANSGSDDLDMEQFLFDAAHQLDSAPKRIVTVDTEGSATQELLSRSESLMDEAPMRRVVSITHNRVDQKAGANGRNTGIGRKKQHSNANDRNNAGIAKKKKAKHSNAIRQAVEAVAPGARLKGASYAARNRRFGKPRNGVRLRGNPHAAGYSCRRVDGELPELSKHAVLVNGQPALLRCIWRGLFKVRGREGAAARDGLASRRLSRTVHRYTRQGSDSIYNPLNRILARAKGRDLPTAGAAGRMREWVIDLVSAVRLLHDPSAVSRKPIYRGLPSSTSLKVYEEAKARAEPVQWHAFASCSRLRSVALGFAGPGGVLFTIRRAPELPTAADISAYSQFPDEHEVLLLPLLAFDVVGMHTRQGDDGRAFTEVVLDERPGMYSVAL